MTQSRHVARVGKWEIHTIFWPDVLKEISARGWDVNINWSGRYGMWRCGL